MSSGANKYLGGRWLGVERSVPYPSIIAGDVKKGGKMKNFLDETFGRVGKWMLWKAGLVELMWFYGKLRLIRTNGETGSRFIFPPHGKDWSGLIQVDSFLERKKDDEELGAYADQRRYSENGFYGYSEFTGFFSKPSVKNLVFKSKKLKVLHMTAAWDREVLEEEKKKYNDAEPILGKYDANLGGTIAAHTHSLNVTPGI